MRRHRLRFVVSQQPQLDSAPECDDVTSEVVSFIHEKLPPDYPWPGNFRELEQCVRNILIRRDYRPTTSATEENVRHPGDFVARVEACRLSANDLMRYYFTLVYRKPGSFKSAAEILGVDWRTVRDKVDPDSPDGAR